MFAAWWRRAPVKHYAAAVQCPQCGHHFSVCVHSARLAASADGLTVPCPENGSKVHVAAGALVPVVACPARTVVVREGWFGPVLSYSRGGPST